MLRLRDDVDVSRLGPDEAIVLTPYDTVRITGDHVAEFVTVFSALRTAPSTRARLCERLDFPAEQTRDIVDTMESLDVFAGDDAEREFLQDTLPSDAPPPEVRAVGLGDPSSLPTYENVAINWSETVEDLTTVLSEDVDVILSFTNRAIPDIGERLLSVVERTSVPWLPVRLVEHRGRIGPVTEPEAEHCFECYRRRWRSTRTYPDVTETVAKRRAQLDISGTYPDSVRHALFGTAVTQTVRYVSSPDECSVRNAVLHRDFRTGETTVDTVLTVPGCERCGPN